MSTILPLEEELRYLYSLERFGIKLGLEVMEQLLAELGNPHQAFKSVHITGTNGKGSTASFMERVLREGGYQVGLYTSPHLYRFNERVQVNGQEISNEQLMQHIEQVRQAASTRSLQPTFFEFTTAIAFLEFARQKVAIAVIEVGMGGVLDATNVITPEVAIITNVGLDHTPLLGTTREEIAQNKAGIIKRGCAVVTAEVDPVLRRIIKDECSRQGASLYEVDTQLAVADRHQTLAGQTFSVRGSFTGELRIALLGQHQVRNALTALLGLQRLQGRGWKIPAAATMHGLAAAAWPGRLDIVSRQPFILVDGAHNNDGVDSLVAFLEEMKDELPASSVLVVAAKQGKNVDELRDKIVARFAHVIVTQGNFEPMLAPDLARILQQGGRQVEIIPDVVQALHRATQVVAPDGMILITGSLYMVGDALQALERKT